MLVSPSCSEDLAVEPQLESRGPKVRSATKSAMPDMQVVSIVALTGDDLLMDHVRNILADLSDEKNPKPLNSQFSF